MLLETDCLAGDAGEAGLYYLALPYIQLQGLHSVSLPNSVNLAFDYSLVCKVRLEPLGSELDRC